MVESRQSSSTRTVFSCRVAASIGASNNTLTRELGATPVPLENVHEAVLGQLGDAALPVDR